MEDGVVNGDKEGKGQGIEVSANANDLWVSMRPHIGFCTIRNCDLLSFFLLIESLPATCKFYPLLFFSQNIDLSTEVSRLFFFFNPRSLFFFEDPSFAGERFHSLKFSRRFT
jgi:hypothetical protein